MAKRKASASPSEKDSETKKAITRNEKDQLKPLVWGFFLSLALTILPVGLIARGIVGLVLALARPLLIVLGAAKIFEEFEKRK